MAKQSPIRNAIRGILQSNVLFVVDGNVAGKVQVYLVP